MEKTMAVTYRLARWCWRCLPAAFRYWLYRTAVHAGTQQQHSAQSWSFRQLTLRGFIKVTLRGFIKSLMGLAYGCWARIGALIRRVTLRNYRDAARSYWPELRGLDLHATTLVFFALRFHTFLLSRGWGNAHHMRKLRRPRARTGPRLKIMHVTSSFDLGGTQSQIRNLCTGVAARFEHETTEIFPELNFLYRRGVAIDRDRYVAGGPLRRAAGRFATDMATRSPQMIQSYKLFRDFDAYRPDVVVGWGHEMCATTFLAASVARVPHIIFCIRTFNPAYGWVDQTTGRLLGVAHRHMTPHVAAVITNSTPLRGDHACWVGIDPARIHVCPNGIEPLSLTSAQVVERRYLVRQELGIDDDMFLAINVGRFSQEKGQTAIISVNERLMGDYRGQLQWLLCGDGPMLPAVRARVAACGMTNVRFLGRTTAVYDYLCASDLFVMPSDFEGMPNAMMEAMACGLPCISTSRSGALDVARHGHEALFYEPGDLQEMERHVRRLIGDRDEARAMGARARARLSEFSTDRFVTRFEEIVESATLRPHENQARLSAAGVAETL